jgi:quercetin dioxygenase-like cupin family protein
MAERGEVVMLGEAPVEASRPRTDPGGPGTGVLTPGSRHRTGPTAESQFLVGPEDGYGPLRLVRLTLPAGSRVQRVETDHDQLIMVMEGVARVTVVDQAPAVLARNEALHVPRGAVVTITAAGPGLELLVLAAPPERPGAGPAGS